MWHLCHINYVTGVAPEFLDAFPKVRACGKAVLEHPLLKTYHEHYKVWRLDTTNTRYEHWTRTLPNLKTCHEHSMCRRTPFSRRIMSTTRSQDLTPTLHNPRTCHEHFICYYCWSIPSSRLIMSTTRSEDLTSTLHNSKTCHEHFMCYVLKHPPVKTYHRHYKRNWMFDTNMCHELKTRTFHVLKHPLSRRITKTTKTQHVSQTRATNTWHEHLTISRLVMNTPRVRAPPSRVSWLECHENYSL